MNFLPSIDTQHNICHLPVGKFQDFIIQKHPVGGQGKPEFFVVLLLQASAVGHQVLYHLPVHQGLSPEKVHFQVHPVPGTGHQKIQGLFSYLKRHQGTPSVIFPLFRKAVPAGQITVMGDMKAQRLYHSLSLFKIIYIIFVNVRGEQASLGFQLQHLCQGFLQFFPCIRKILISADRRPDHVCIFFALLHKGFHQGNDIIDDIIHHMNGTAVHIHHDVVPIVLILVYHFFVPFQTVKHMFRSPVPPQNCLRIPFCRSALPGSVFVSQDALSYDTTKYKQRRNPLLVLVVNVTYVITSPARSSDCLRCRKSCRQTGRKSGTHHSRPSSWIPLNSWWSKS